MPIKRYLVTVHYTTHEGPQQWETIVRTRSPELAAFKAGGDFFARFWQVAQVNRVAVTEE